MKHTILKILWVLGYGDENLIIKSRFSDKEDKKIIFSIFIRKCFENATCDRLKYAFR